MKNSTFPRHNFVTINFNNLKYPKLANHPIYNHAAVSCLFWLKTFTQFYRWYNWPPYSSFRQPPCGHTFLNRALPYAILNPSDSFHFPPFFSARAHTQFWPCLPQLRTAKLFLPATLQPPTPAASPSFAFQQVRNASAREDGLLSRTGERIGWRVMREVLATNPFLRIPRRHGKLSR